MLDSLTLFLEANGFSIFMIGWLVALAGAVMHLIGGGFRDGGSKVPVLGNWEEVKPGEKGFLQQLFAVWVLRMGVILVALGGFLHFF